MCDAFFDRASARLDSGEAGPGTTWSLQHGEALNALAEWIAQAKMPCGEMEAAQTAPQSKVKEKFRRLVTRQAGDVLSISFARTTHGAAILQRSRLPALPIISASLGSKAFREGRLPLPFILRPCQRSTVRDSACPPHPQQLPRSPAPKPTRTQHTWSPTGHPNQCHASRNALTTHRIHPPPIVPSWSAIVLTALARRSLGQPVVSPAPTQTQKRSTGLARRSKCRRTATKSRRSAPRCCGSCARLPPSLDNEFQR